MTNRKVGQLEAERDTALSKVETVAKEAEANLRRAERAESELESALERVQELEASIKPLEARAESLSTLLTGIGRNVGAALKDTEAADGDLSLFESALTDNEELQVKTRELEQQKEQTDAEVESLSQKLSFAERKAQLLDSAEARAKRLSEGLKQIMSKSGANNRRGFFGALFGRTEEEMIQDTLDQIDDLKKSGSS